MEFSAAATSLILLVFALGYAAIILEFYLKIHKSAIALLISGVCWIIYFTASLLPISEDLHLLGMHVYEISEILFFLMGAMTLVELIDSHDGFKIVTSSIRTTSKIKMLWIISFVTFFLSAIFDNLTSTILMVSVLRKLVPHAKERFTLNCLVIVAANAGGAWTPIGDVTTSMLWIGGQLSTWPVMKDLFLPSLVSMVVPAAYFTWKARGSQPVPKRPYVAKAIPGANIVFFAGIGCLMLVPVLKSLIGLPPFLGMIFGLSILWAITDILHRHYEERSHLRVPHILTRIDISGILFFLGILLAVKVLDTLGLLTFFANWLSAQVSSVTIVATIIGIISALIDNVPLVAATMGMYPLKAYPIDSPLWHLIAYAAGTGGSILIIGSAAGVALMGMEKMDFIAYMKKASLPILLGYLAGILVCYLLFAV